MKIKIYFTLKSYYVFSCHKFNTFSYFVIAFLSRNLDFGCLGFPPPPPPPPGSLPPTLLDHYFWINLDFFFFVFFLQNLNLGGLGFPPPPPIKVLNLCRFEFCVLKFYNFFIFFLSSSNNPRCMSHYIQKSCTFFMHDDTATWFSAAVAVRAFWHEQNPEPSVGLGGPITWPNLNILSFCLWIIWKESEVRQLIFPCTETATEGRRRMRVNLFLYWNLLHNWDISARAITLNETCNALYGNERQTLKIFANLLLSEELSVIQKSAICY